jgi:hypothetical protein
VYFLRGTCTYPEIPDYSETESPILTEMRKEKEEHPSVDPLRCCNLLHSFRV